MPTSLAVTQAEVSADTLGHSGEASVADTLQIFLQRRRLVLGTALVCLLLATGYLLLAPKKYTATATIEINKDNSMSLGLDDLSGIESKLGTGADLLTDLMTHEADLENETTAIDTIKRMNLLATEPYAPVPGKDPVIDSEHGLPIEKAPATRERALRLFSRRMKVKLVKNTRLISVSYTDTDAARAAAVANAIVEVYLSNHTEARYAASLKTSKWLTAQLAELKDKVAQSERRVSEFQQKAGLVGVYISNESKSSAAGGLGGLPQVNSIEDERLIALNSQLTGAEVERIGREAMYRFAQTGDANVVAGLGSSLMAGSGGGGGAQTSLAGLDLSSLQSLRQQQTALKLQYAAALGKYGPRNPEMIDLRSQLGTMESEISAELARIQAQTKSAYEIALAAETSIRKQVLGEEKAVGKLDQSVAGLMVLEQESVSNRLLYQDMYTRLEEANLTAGLGTGVITISDPARAPSSPSSPLAVTVLGLGLAGGLFLGALSAMTLDQLQNILYTPDDIAKLLPFAQLGVIPDFNSGHHRRTYGGQALPLPAPREASKEPRADLGRIAWLHLNPTSPVSEAFRQIRTSVLLSKSARPPRTMLLTSALSGDGKSVTSFNLATAFAYQGARVLLVDADMRRPSVHKMAGCAGDVGLSNVLTGSVTAAEAILPHPEIAGLFILPAGVIPPMPAELLGSQRFTDLLREFESAYDYVLLDTPPLLLVTDPLLLAPKVEGVILVSRPGRDTRHAIKSAAAMLSRPQLRVLGYVVNGVSMNATYYRYEGQEG